MKKYWYKYNIFIVFWMMTNLFKGNQCDDDNDCDADQSCNDQKCKSKEKVMQQHHQILMTSS